MPELVFFHGKEHLFRFHIEQQNTRIGRDPACDISLPSPEISRVHILIVSKASKFTLKDKSLNGTYVNGRFVKEHELKSDDVIQVGSWKIQFVDSTLKEGDETLAAAGQSTKYLADGGKGKKKGEFFITASVLLPDGSRISREFDTIPVHIGQGSGNDLVINDSFISSNHCKVWLEGEKMFIRDLASTNGIFIKGNKIKESTLHSGEIVRLGQTEIRFQIVKREELSVAHSGTHFYNIVGKSPRMREVFAMIERVAPSDHSVVIIGDTGTGKELVAQAVHSLSPRAKKPFVVVNCGAISPQLIESELFGHEKGAFTGAAAQHTGAFEQANGGTIFLDEIGELPIDLQPKLLRVIEGKPFRRVGGSSDVKADVRVLTATHRDLSERVKQGKFREDLFFRLFVVPVFLPPLSQRREDIPILVEYFLNSGAAGGEAFQLSQSAMEKMMNYPWPGNVRELRNVLTRSVILAEGKVLDGKDLKFLQGISVGEEEVDGELEQIEKEAIVSKLNECNWNKRLAAEALGIAKSTLFKKIKRYSLKP